MPHQAHPAAAAADASTALAWAAHGELLALVAQGHATSRIDLQQASGLARVTVTQRVQALLEAGWLVETDRTLPSGGRPKRVLALDAQAAWVLAGNVGETQMQVAVCDLQTRTHGGLSLPRGADRSAAATLQALGDAWAALLADLPKVQGRAPLLAGIGLSLPAPVDHRRGRVVGPSVLPGWDDLDLREPLQQRFGVPVLVDNDVNLMALHEHRCHHAVLDDMVLIKAGTGIGSGILVEGRLLRGAQGAAGDLGHIQSAAMPAPLCRCGKRGCVEAHAAGWALVQQLQAQGLEVHSTAQLMARVQQGCPQAVDALRRAARVLGDAVADLVSVLNPGLIVLGGQLARAGDLLLDGVRERIYQRCLPLATRELRLALARGDADAELDGAARLVLEHMQQPRGLQALLQRDARTRDPGRAATAWR